MKLNLILAKISLLRGLIDPDWVDGGPGQPGPLVTKISEPSVNLLLSQHIRAAAQLLHNAELGEKLHALGRHIATEAISQLGAAWEEGDDLCPPWHVFPHGPPRPHGWEWVALNPQPLPPKEVTHGSIRDVLIAIALRDIASLTSSGHFNREIQSLSTEIIRASTTRLIDDCATPVPHRLPPHGGPSR